MCITPPPAPVPDAITVILVSPPKKNLNKSAFLRYSILYMYIMPPPCPPVPDAITWHCICSPSKKILIKRIPYDALHLYVILFAAPCLMPSRCIIGSPSKKILSKAHSHDTPSCICTYRRIFCPCLMPSVCAPDGRLKKLQENIQYWLECDVDDHGFPVLTDDGIIASVIDDQDSCDDEVGPSDNDIVKKGPSTEEAFLCQCKWLEQEKECYAVVQTCLRFSARKRGAALKQKKILNFFPY
ncbi:hypothetical protein AVEN_218241-1 [Araneus ventricosus]|uniref:Uncharacterized protein n=1 Tax=Araneus ventricosus TaxID=182803 RepID=A0A4Y2LKP1_ARAVE|nr:hypothetical protein AVEN_218241-1 [Araneus ventricosus]